MSVLEETWEASSDASGPIDITRENDEYVGYIYGEDAGHLAAAAPELYRALMVILEREYVGDEYRDPALAALAKARGEL